MGLLFIIKKNKKGEENASNYFNGRIFKNKKKQH